MNSLGKLRSYLQPCRLCAAARSQLCTPQDSRVIFQKRSNHYDVLRIRKTATTTEVKEAFVHLSKQLHPDMNPEDPLTHEKFVKLNEAYTVLKDAASRSKYDLSLNSPGSTVPPGGMDPASAQWHYYQQRSAQAGNYHPPKERSGFWDETIYEMRDKSKDRHVPEDEYYGIKGIKKQPDWVIVAGCIMFMILGGVLNYCYFKFTRQYLAGKKEQKDQRNKRYLREAQERANKLGNQKSYENMVQNFVDSGKMSQEKADELKARNLVNYTKSKSAAS